MQKHEFQLANQEKLQTVKKKSYWESRYDLQDETAMMIKKMKNKIENLSQKLKPIEKWQIEII